MISKYNPALLYRNGNIRRVRVEYTDPRDAAYHAIDLHSRHAHSNVTKPIVLSDDSTLPQGLHLFGLTESYYDDAKAKATVTQVA